MKAYKSMKRGERFFLVLGVVLIIVGFLANEYLLAALFSRDGTLAAKTKVLIRVFNLGLISAGALTILFRRAKGIVNFYLLTGTLMIFLAVLETILRIPGWRKRGELPLNILDEQLHHTLRSNTSALVKWGDAEVIYHTNSLGYRDATIREIDRQTEADKRILFLGDSFTEGVGVSWDEHFINLLAKSINLTGRSVEMLNAGIIGYCPSLEYRKLKQFLDEGYETDSVILMFDISDIHDEAVFYDGWERRGPTDPILGSTNMYPMILRQLSSRLKPLFTQKLSPEERKLSPGERNWTEFPAGQIPWVEKGLQICKNNILNIAELCRLHGIEFTLVIYPQPTQLQSPIRPSLAQVIFGDFARKHEINLYDLFDDFFLVTDWQDYFIPGDIHWNSLGHKLVAQALLTRLSSGPALYKKRAKVANE